jgi:hypothetical protein
MFRLLLTVDVVVGILLWAGTAHAEDSTQADTCVVMFNVEAHDLGTYQFEREDPSAVALPDERALLLGDVRVVGQPVFEVPTNPLHRMANRYHPQTREGVIYNALPVHTGEAVNQRKLDEAERILRAKAYLYDAWVIPWRICADRVDIVVVVRDVWTLTPIIDISRSGGENEVDLGIADTNVLGNGKNVSVEYRDGRDRNGVQFFYNDPNLSGSRWTLDLVAAANDDGGRYRIDVGRPFYALDAQRGFGLGLEEFDRDQGLYFLSDKFWEIDARSERADIAFGFSEGVRQGFVNRWFVGLAYENHDFEFPSAFPAPGKDRTLAYPYLAFQRIADRFEERVNLDRVQRTEDLGLGHQIYAQIGLSDSAFGSDTDRLVGRFSFDDLDYLADKHLLAYGFNVHGYYDLQAGRTEDLWANAYVTYRVAQSARFSLLVRASGVLVKNLPVDKQLLAGGDSGLRGYPNRYQPGDRRLLLTVEERYYADIYPFGMFRLGGALFFDIGRAWYEDDAPDWIPDNRQGPQFKTLADVGFGLRLESTRTRRDRILHLDVAFPLRDGPGISGMEITITARQSL